MANANSFLTGSINLSKIPKELMKKVTLKDGTTNIFLNIAIFAKSKPQTFGDGDKARTYTHSVSCAPPKDQRKEGVNYFIGDLEERTPTSNTPTPEQIESAPSLEPQDDLPF